MPLIVAYRVPCNVAVADDDTVQVGRIEGTDDEWEVGFLGILNGIFGTDDRGVGFIAAHIDDERPCVHRVRPLDKEGRWWVGGYRLSPLCARTVQPSRR